MTPEQFFNFYGYMADAPNGIKKLRELILQLAVQGKLVPQDRKHEPATTLLTKIKSDKERLLKENKLKKIDKFPIINTDNEPYELPKGWVWTYLGEISNIIHYGYTASADHNLKEVRLLRITDIQNNRVNWETVPGCEILPTSVGSYSLNNGDLLIARTGGTIGKTYLVENINVCAVFASYLIRVVPNQYSMPTYLKLFAETPLYWKQLYEKSMGTGQPNVNGVSLSQLLLPLPPIAEQGMIVTKVGQLMKLCDELEVTQVKTRQKLNKLNNSALERLLYPPEQSDFIEAWKLVRDNFDLLYATPETVTKLRQAILQLAMIGKLVPQNQSDEPASKLLEKIQIEKIKLAVEKNIRKSDTIIEIKDNEVKNILPEGWKWVRLGDICYQISDGTHFTPTYTTTGIPFLSVKDVSQGKINLDNTRFISLEEHQSLTKRCKPEYEDILFTKVGTTGIARVIDIKSEFSIFVSLALLKYPQNLIYPYFLESLLNSPIVKSQSDANTQGVGNKNLVLKSISGFVIPLPPLAEQQRIITKIKQLMLLCDELEIKLTKSQSKLDKAANAVVQTLLTA